MECNTTLLSVVLIVLAVGFFTLGHWLSGNRVKIVKGDTRRIVPALFLVLACYLWASIFAAFLLAGLLPRSIDVTIIMRVVGKGAVVAWIATTAAMIWLGVLEIRDAVLPDK